MRNPRPNVTLLAAICAAVAGGATLAFQPSPNPTPPGADDRAESTPAHTLPASPEPPAPASPLAEPGPADPFTSRAAAGMLNNIADQGVLVPEADFVKRLAEAGAWLPAPEIEPLYPNAQRFYRVPVPSTRFYVVDDGSGDDITVLIPRADAAVIRDILAQTLTLEPLTPVAPEAGTETDAAALLPPPGHASRTFAAFRDDIRAGTLTFSVASPRFFGPDAIAIRFIANPDLEAGDDAHDGPSFTIRDDGTIELANGQVIRGDGTAAHPYDISWDLLVSAERVYQPRQGLTDLPDWATQFHGSHIRLTGHLLSPLMMDDTDQILIMRNQWDGCCIGVPPTPYDAVEVVLERPISLVREQLNYGTITGVLEVDPYLVNNWLVGLYVLKDADVASAGARNWSPAAVPN
ncbi:MAG: hypothetical protein H6809_06250 [Phycisphaeraceae bacterium]|nr:hypothetical protein [Phycisphaeraceae bacterium]